ncbi:deoxynucleotidyltransferase terminal-interacting protein 1 [Lampris incognitus]|uniref:deoxynucleotidyltransferase terminal-interacting protein 1 n=1 Tax=Lampris incognitus TaxID=2546036 RepID=UPI0024B60697|nr:deoxynucleotidyltransferase terminal-interacting protein 1 [Lampris incognitus]
MGAHRSEGRRDWLEPDGGEEPVQAANPWNLMIKHRQVHRRGRRSHMTVSYSDPVVSMDLLRAVLQPSFNDDIMAVFRKYQKFFEKAAENVKENVGEEVQADLLIRDACRNILEHAKQLFPEAEMKMTRPGSEININVKRCRQADEDSSQRGSPVPKKRKGRPAAVVVTDTSLNYSTQAKPKTTEPVRRDGPKWDPSRLNHSSTFVLGSRANKALGMGGTRGRIYIKHADLFKYAADAQDKHWLAERQHMRATGGKMAYLLIEEDIQDLARSDEYRDCPDLKMDELKPFSVPPWMVEKMQRAMEAQRAESQ